MSSSTISNISLFTQKYTFYTSLIIFCIGFIGNLINILIFTTLKHFRNNPSILYFTAESIANTIQLILFFLMNILIQVNETDPANLSLFWCKFRGMMISLCTLVSFSTICFSASHQYLSTSHHFYLRQLSTIKTARFLICISVIISMLQTIPFGIFIEIQASVCAIFNQNMLNYISYFYYPVLSGLLPVLIASVFSILAYNNVRRIVRKQMPVVRRRLDQQLTAMILIRIIMFIVLTLPYDIVRMYTYIAKVDQSNQLYYAIINLIGSILVTFFNLNYAISFYVFLTTSVRFRRQVKRVLVKKCWGRCKRCFFNNNNKVHPFGMRGSLTSSVVVQ
ncbi:unnamed protein product [Adineta steineri]|uniref:G-protein coupled receptors family 1 profile domain-containing protein n=1 Tax=Adineta steineri TaxID=433720 RepID=A0A816FEL2_9BILA|nr:unnamed protein product [Adineta steineri]CAF1549256.1 unnamed protein product [Adineta steineri]CAF1660534.1 unnamed protein product [Adineta steineri]CAF1660543.1 unnamed protein product [Adineta steineri]